jgi:hypothetical protein
MQLTSLPASGHIASPLQVWGDISAALAATYHKADFMSLIEAIPTIAEVRKVQHFASQTPAAGRKVVVLGFADQFRAETSNSLLKLLEEPPEYLSILLLSESGRLLPTVRSRVREVVSGLIEGEVLPSEKTHFQRWQELLSSYRVEGVKDCRDAKRLLYLQPLNHATVNQDEVLEAYQSN